MARAESKDGAPTHSSPLERPIHGVWSPCLIPVRADYSIDTARFLTHARWLLDQGCHGLALFGTTSEATSFSVEERMALLDALLATGLDPDRLMVGTGCCAMTDSVRLTRHASEMGCRKVLMLPPFYYKGVSDEGLIRSFATVIDRVADEGLRVLLYHFPKLTGVPITPHLIEALSADYPDNIAGVKDSSGDWSHTAQLIARFPALCIFPGSERFLLQGLNNGGVGCITATANVNAAGARGVWNAWHSKSEDLQARNAQMVAVRAAIEAHSPIPAQKFLLARHRKDPEWRRVRPPLVELGDEAGSQLLSTLAQIDFAIG